MKDTTVHVTKLITISAWAISGLMLLTAWSCVLFGGEGARHAGYLVGVSAAIVSVWAGTLQVRCWAIRVCALVRLTGGLESDAVPVRTLR